MMENDEKWLKSRNNSKEIIETNRSKKWLLNCENEEIKQIIKKW